MESIHPPLRTGTFQDTFPDFADETELFIQERSDIDAQDKVRDTKGLKSVVKSCCTVEKSLLKYKFFFLSFGGAIGAFFPYWSVYCKQMGLSPNQIGLVSGLRPFIGIWSGPLWGSIADRFRIRKIILVCSTLGWLLFITPIGFVPSADYSDEQCLLVRDFLNIQGNITNETVSEDLREMFKDLHKPKLDVSPMENLIESRGWMYDSSGLASSFYVIIILLLLGELVQSPTGALADSMCLGHLKNNIDSYGKQRAFGSIGIGVVSFAVGAIVSTTRHDIYRCGVKITISNYKTIFIVFAVCMFCCTVSTFFFKGKSKEEDDKEKKKVNPFKVFRMFLTAHYASWLLCMFFTGVCNGVIWGFLAWHLENIGANQLLLGLAQSISLFSEMVMFLVVFKILNKVSSLTFMCIGLLGYSIRFAVFASMRNPWLVLPFEILQGATFAGVWSAFVKYMCSHVPEDYSGTLQGFLHSMYWGLGSGSGHLIAGVMIEHLGARLTFWIFSGLSFTNMVVFVIIQKCSKRHDVFQDYTNIPEEDTSENVL